MNQRQIIKKAFKILFRILVIPIYVIFKFFSICGNKDSVFRSCSQAISLVPGTTGVYLRAAFYHLTCPNTSEDIVVGFLTIFSHQDTTIERGVYIGPQCNIGQCHIGQNTLLGSGVHILSGNKQHSFKELDTPIQEQGGFFEKIKIGEDCWIGNGAIVMTSVESHSIVAAGSVVIKEIGSGLIVGGNPAKIIRKR